MLLCWGHEFVNQTDARNRLRLTAECYKSFCSENQLNVYRGAGRGASGARTPNFYWGAMSLQLWSGLNDAYTTKFRCRRQDTPNSFCTGTCYMLCYIRPGRYRVSSRRFLGLPNRMEKGHTLSIPSLMALLYLVEVSVWCHWHTFLQLYNLCV